MQHFRHTGVLFLGMAAALLTGCMTAQTPEKAVPAAAAPQHNQKKLPETPRPAVSPLPPTAAKPVPTTPKPEALKLPLYRLQLTDSAETTSHLTLFAATEQEPEKAGLLPQEALLMPLCLEPGKRFSHPDDQVVVWLYALLEIPAPLNGVTLKTATEGHAQIYLNGSAVYSGGHTAHTFRLDADEISGIAFQKGRNLLVIRLKSAAPFWRFSLRFFDAKGHPLYWESRW